jgi:NADH-quinone oxidoreductase subunit I
MKNALTEIYTGFKSLLTGMRITLGQFFKPIVTVQYPYETLKIPARFRGHIELVRDPNTGIAKCFVCKLCEKACPSDCITVEGVKPEGARRKTVTFYRLDFTKCSLCGSCVEACRDGAIRFSREYNLAGLNKDDFVMDLFKRLQAEAGPETKSEIKNPDVQRAGEPLAKSDAATGGAAAGPDGGQPLNVSQDKIAAPKPEPAPVEVK